MTIMNTRIVLIALVAAACPALGFGQSERSLIGDGNKQYNQQKFSDAEVNYRKALAKNHDSKQGVFNLGDALYKQGRFGEAAEQYAMSASRAGKGSIKSDAYYNLGNALLKSQKIPESISAYKEALKINPKDFDSKYNLELAKTLLQQQQQQKQNQQNQKDKNQQKDQKQNQQQNQQNQQKQENQQNQAQQDQLQNQKKQQFSKQDAERILEALRNQEKEVQKKLHKKAPARVKIEKDW